MYYIMYFIMFQTTKMELQNPIAFSILAHEQFSVLEVLIATIFRPHNSYCIFIDEKASGQFYQLVNQMVECYKERFPQVQYHPK